ncbi:xanthine dehydrogenase/oxidase-like [Halichondria panicea]
MTALCDYLVDKDFSDPATLKDAVDILSSLVLQDTPLSASSEYRMSLATTLFYKFIVCILPKPLPPSLQSVVVPPTRAVSRGKQLFSSIPSEYPITQPLTKLTAKLQASGEAQYISDCPVLPKELAAAFVLTTMGNAEIISIDCSTAKKLPGFVKMLTSKDIPGDNNFMSDRDAEIPEEVFAEKISQYAGQPVALVLADTQEHADRIACAVEVTHKTLGPPILTLEEAIQRQSFFSSPRRTERKVGDTEAAMSGADHVITGKVELGSQYHYHMETHTAVVIPDEGGFKVQSATQWVDRVQAAVAMVMNIPASSVDVSVKRIGGAYGAKTTRPNLVAAACALGASVTGRPVRMYMDLETNMKAIGKRFPYMVRYKLGSTKEGVITAIDVEIFADCGVAPNENAISVVRDFIDNAYYVPNWKIATQPCKTNTPANVFCRSPGTLPSIFMMETMIDHLATSLGMDVEVVKVANLYKNGHMTLVGKELTNCNMSRIWEQLYQSAEVDRRKKEISEYNKTSRWYKRGLNMMPLKYTINWAEATPYYVTVNIYAEDGTVAIAHGGVEMGQGINTKVAQVASKVLGVPLEKIRIKPTDSMLNPNGIWSGASTTSELNCLGTINACKELNSRIDSIREQIPGLEWEDLIQMASSAGVNLSARAFVSESCDGKFNYVCWGSTVTEVGVDVLTGETRVERVDILYDCGDSLNPEIDIGQVEGAFVMGLGYWLSEKIVYNKETGQLLTHNTWEYKPPSHKDIPIDFRVELLKDATNPFGVLGSKAAGEPPQCMSCSALFAVKRAIESARADAGISTHFTLDGPATVENIQQACLTSTEQLSIIN